MPARLSMRLSLFVLAVASQLAAAQDVPCREAAQRFRSALARVATCSSHRDCVLLSINPKPYCCGTEFYSYHEPHAASTAIPLHGLADQVKATCRAGPVCDCREPEPLALHFPYCEQSQCRVGSLSDATRELAEASLMDHHELTSAVGDKIAEARRLVAAGHAAQAEALLSSVQAFASLEAQRHYEIGIAMSHGKKHLHHRIREQMFLATRIDPGLKAATSYALVGDQIRRGQSAAYELDELVRVLRHPSTSRIEAARIRKLLDTDPELAPARSKDFFNTTLQALDAPTWSIGQPVDAKDVSGAYRSATVLEISVERPLRVRIGWQSSREALWVDSSQLAAAGSKSKDAATSGEVLVDRNGQLTIPPGAAFGLVSGGQVGQATGPLIGTGRGRAKTGDRVRLSIKNPCGGKFRIEQFGGTTELAGLEMELGLGARIMRHHADGHSPTPVATIGPSDRGIILDLCSAP